MLPYFRNRKNSWKFESKKKKITWGNDNGPNKSVSILRYLPHCCVCYDFIVCIGSFLGILLSRCTFVSGFREGNIPGRTGRETEGPLVGVWRLETQRRVSPLKV